MKRHFVNVISMAFAGIILTSANASNAIELKHQINNTSAPFHLTKDNNGGDEGIKGKIMISGVVGFNATRASLIVRYDGSNYAPDITSSKQIPIINLGVDYGFGKKFSIGAAVGFQSITLTADPLGNGNTATGSAIVDTWKRIHLAVRGDYYIIAKDNISLYTGLKLGYNMYTVTSTYSKFDPNYITNLKNSVVPSAIATQAHFGFSYYFNGMVGVNTEVGLAVGGPYYFSAGVAFKL